ncbi:DeoR/GlpR family DNA-binding transcription regulator [Streptomyces sp. DSM 44915]|uniref:Lactose phosphotransferase system repressor n=1 Tax=Streptomyces chisholmiae TaxID=3075540 RepID=A0ABU2JY07_9ACTN|nr:DeoR/GlpR family DNA-binding transcription regulator [Streptomyces sp. DSM 44915]MDT0269638.1 DeoR/GlpR family DNA-binding transcription regulator [Streptomyces sp. DSM 44915]
MYAAERQREIMSVIRLRDRASVQDLAQALGVTPETVRRDLTALERRGLLRRTHGGAVHVERVSFSTPVTDRAGVYDAEKDAIAAGALERIVDDSTIGIDAGTTTIKLAELIPKTSRLTVVTYSLIVASELAAHPGVQIHFLGGQIQENSRAAVGTWALEHIGRITLDQVFLSVDGINTRHGLSTHNLAEAQVKAALMNAARHTVVMADRSKFGREEFGRVAPLADVDLIITDAGVSAEQLAEVREQGPEVIAIPGSRATAPPAE